MSSEENRVQASGLDVMSAYKRIEVEVLPNRVVRAAAHVKILHIQVARLFCNGIQDATHSANAQGLVMDLNTLGQATLPAGLYAIRQLKGLTVERIALVGGNSFMRLFARIVLTLGRFGSFAFFENEPEAIAWAGEVSN